MLSKAVSAWIRHGRATCFAGHLYSGDWALLSCSFKPRSPRYAICAHGARLQANQHSSRNREILYASDTVAGRSTSGVICRRAGCCRMAVVRLRSYAIPPVQDLRASHTQGLTLVLPLVGGLLCLFICTILVALFRKGRGLNRHGTKHSRARRRCLGRRLLVPISNGSGRHSRRASAPELGSSRSHGACLCQAH